jgi:hypothetical protein
MSGALKTMTQGGQETKNTNSLFKKEGERR